MNGLKKIKIRQTINKKLIFAMITCLIVLFTSFTVYASTNQFDTIYHVYVNGERVGTIDNEDSYRQLVKQKLSSHKNQDDQYTYVIGEKITLIPEKVFQGRAMTKQTLDELNEILTVKAEAVALQIEGENVLYVKDEETAKSVLDKFVLQYVSQEQLAQFKKQTNKEKPSVGERLIRNIEFTKPIEIVNGVAEVTEILNEEQALKKLNLGTLEEKKYVVQAGDVLGTIAEKHGLTVSDLLRLNPSITENTLLQIGQELSVTAYEPIVKVMVEESVTLEEDIPFVTETKEDSNMWKGDSKVTQEGSNGVRIASYEIVKENGETVKKELVEETVIKEPVNRIVVVGTKESPSRGTGSFSWPAVGGYISSYQGMRWGRLHKGIDIAGPSNLSILAADNGTVIYTGYNGGYGNMVKINHNNGMVTLYAHLSSIDVSVGQVVGKGQKIGVMGSTGNSTGTHLHFEVYKNGQLVNPTDFLKR